MKNKFSSVMNVLKKTSFDVKNAYFNQSTWLPGRSTKNYPQFQKTYREKTALYVCISCHLRRYMSAAKRCPRCGHSMNKS